MIPRYIEKKILKTFHGTVSSQYKGCFIVDDETLEKWLIKNIGIYSDAPIIELSNGTKVKFNWNIQKFMLAA